MGQKGSRHEPSDGNFDRRAAHRLSKGRMKKDDIQLGAASIHQMEATLPMPSEVEVDEKFSRMVVSVGLSRCSVRNVLLALNSTHTKGNAFAECLIPARISENTSHMSNVYWAGRRYVCVPANLTVINIVYISAVPAPSGIPCLGIRKSSSRFGARLISDFSLCPLCRAR